MSLATVAPRVPTEIAAVKCVCIADMNRSGLTQRESSRSLRSFRWATARCSVNVEVAISSGRPRRLGATNFGIYRTQGQVVAIKPAWNLPTLVGKFLDRLAETPRKAFDPFEVRQETPEARVLETVTL